MPRQQNETEVGLCECGCGTPTRPARNTDSRRGWVKGQPIHFILGHSARKRPEDVQRYRGSGSQREHRAIAQRVLGKPLPRKADVHHVNGIKWDNRHCNLVMCENRAYHMLLHLRQAALDATGNPNLRRCFYCGHYGDPQQMFTKSGSMYHVACGRADSRKRNELRKKAAA